jgi:hypothetical protein
LRTIAASGPFCLPISWSNSMIAPWLSFRAARASHWSEHMPSLTFELASVVAKVGCLPSSARAAVMYLYFIFKHSSSRRQKAEHSIKPNSHLFTMFVRFLDFGQSNNFNCSSVRYILKDSFAVSSTGICTYIEFISSEMGDSILVFKALQPLNSI